MFFLGYGARTWLDYPDGAHEQQVILTDMVQGGRKCIYRLTQWVDMHAYVISGTAMARWRDIKYETYNSPIDDVLSYSASKFFVVRPQSAFQRIHRPRPGQSGTQITGSPYQILKQDPSYLYQCIDPILFNTSLYRTPPAPDCLPPVSALTNTDAFDALPDYLSSLNVSDAGVPWDRNSQEFWRLRFITQRCTAFPAASFFKDSAPSAAHVRLRH